MLTRHGFNFDFEHGFELPAPVEIAHDAITGTLPEVDMALLEDVLNLIIIQSFAWPKSIILVADYLPTTEEEVFENEVFSYYIENDEINFYLMMRMHFERGWFIYDGHPLWDAFWDFYFLAMSIMVDYSLDVLFGLIDYTTIQNALEDHIINVNNKASEFAALVTELNLLYIDDELMGNYQEIRAEILERLDLPFGYEFW